MSVTPAAGLPRLGPGEFRFVTKAMEAEQSSPNGQRRFKTIASSTIKDMSGDEMKMSALEDMRDAFRRGITIFLNHKYVVPEDVFGRSDTAEIKNSGEVDPKSGFPIYDLHVSGFVDEANPRAIQAADSMASGMIYGTSVGAIVRAHQKNKAGGMDIIHVDLKEGSMVGVPMNQRSWAQKSATAAAALPEDEEEVDDTEQTDDVVAAPDDTTKSITTAKADMSAATRNDLPDSEFACPEKRKYPINDKAHVRAALSRIADPSNDQCGRDKIMAAARRMGIGDHESKGLEPEDLQTWSDEDLTTWAMQNSCPTCGRTHNEETGDCPDDYHTQKSIEDSQGLTEPAEEESDSTQEATGDGQPEGEAEPEAAADESTPESEKAYSVDPTDVVELVRHVGVLVEKIAALQLENAALLEQVNGEQERRKSAEADVELAKTVIDKVMETPLRRKAIGHLADKTFAERFPQYAPEIAEYLSRGDQ